METCILNGRPPQSLAPASPLLLAAVFVMVALLYGLHGFHGTLTRDDAINIYMAQRMLYEGVPPYQSIFIQQGPGTAFLNFFALCAGHAIGIADDIQAVRIVAWLVLSLAHIPLFLLARKGLGNTPSAWLAVAIFASFWAFGAHLASGPSTKSWIVMLMCCHFWLAMEKRWFWAGIASGLAALGWQPMAALSIISLVVVLVQPGPMPRHRAFLVHFTGHAIPWLATFAYFGLNHAFADFWEGMVNFNLHYVATKNDPPAQKLYRLANALFSGFKGSVIFIPVGLITVLLQGLRASLHWKTLPRQANLLILLSLPTAIAWTALDFQSYPDLFVFLPFAALGCAAALQAACARLSPAAQGRITLALTTLIILLAGLSYRDPGTGIWIKSKEGLRTQQQAIRDFRLAPGEELASVGVPEALVILRRPNFSQHIQFGSGLDDYLQDHYPGGIEGWLKDLRERKPAIVAYGYADWQIFGGRLHAWLDQDYDHEVIAQWDVYFRKDRPKPQQAPK